MTERASSGPGLAVPSRLLAAVGLVLTAPVLALSGVGIRLSSPGPILYRAQRAGLDGEPFTMFKLRTMHLQSAGGSPITSRGDPRIFRLGRVLRRFKIDELPQLANVVRGEMAFVGPRPEDIDIVNGHYDSVMRETLRVRPGITSPGSLSYFTSEADLPDDPAEVHRIYLDRLLREKIALDLVWVRHRTTAYDLELVVRTLLGAMGIRRGFRKRQEWELRTAASILRTWHETREGGTT
jgi:lipopolysaccharide/colanic/teichoic acid biosynthesis glycosyltransferase